MNLSKELAIVLAMGAVAWLGQPSTAHANLKACGDVFVSADADCEFRKTEECMTECTTESVQTSCSAKIYTSCETDCTASASASCESSCTETCTPNCEDEVDSEQPPSCMGLCVSDCEKSKAMDDTCGDSDRRGPCHACFAHTCNDKCEKLCAGKPEETKKPAECMPTCTTACSGSCTAQANVQCQVDCQTDVYTECETEQVKTCKTECKDKGGAIFCDGQFLNSTSLESCADELNAKISVKVDVSVDAVTDTAKDTTTKSKKKAKSLCSVSNVGIDHGQGGAIAALGFGACALVISRKRR